MMMILQFLLAAVAVAAPPLTAMAGRFNTTDPTACPTCPWGDPAFGPYPSPINAQSSFQPVHRGNYFDVYGDWVQFQYSEVFWTAQPAVPLPADFVAQFQGKAAAFTGFEVNVVRLFPNGTEQTVPQYETYNHHYCATIIGSAAQMTFVGDRASDSLLKDPTRTARRAIEVHPAPYEPRSLPNDPNPNSTIPTAHNFWQGNGGEHRKSFKYLPSGFGQLVESPTQFMLQPMLINTKNPGGEWGPQARGGPLPRNSKAPPGANYSGLMECPCTTRTVKILSGYATRSQGTCAAADVVSSAAECWTATAALIQPLVGNTTLNSTAFPPGCYVQSSSNGVQVFFNEAAGSVAPCGASSGPVRAKGAATSTGGDLTVALDLDGTTGNATITLTGPAALWFGIGFNASTMADAPYTITVDGTGAVQERRLADHMPGSPLATTVSVVSNTVGPAPEVIKQLNHYGSPWTTLNGSAAADCDAACAGQSICLAWTWDPPQFVTPYNLNLGVCYLRQGLSDPTGANTGFTSEGYYAGMVSGQKGVGQVRTVVLQRPLVGASDSYYTFDPTVSAIAFIEAVGTTATFQYHGPSRGGATMMMVEVGHPVCICRGDHVGGSINGIPFADNCSPFPATTIARDDNPSCSIESYGGGMLCCHHGIFLLDADQEVPPAVDQVRMKFRFFYEDPTGIDSYQNAFFMFRETEDNHGEYDVPQCAAGTPPDQCVHTITGQFQLKDGMHKCQDRSDVWCSPSKDNVYPQSQFVQLLHIAPHCHGPACLSMEMINMDTNESICKSHMIFGEGDAPMDEAGYASSVPPCVWGSDVGLEAPPVLNIDTNILVIKKVNSTNFHYGVMGHWQMRGAWADAPPA